MAGQGCINEGHDDRLLGHIVCWLQRNLSWKSVSRPYWLVKIERPGYVVFGIAWPPYVVVQRSRDLKYRLFRLGFRYDVNWGGYIFPTAAWKTTERPLELGY